MQKALCPLTKKFNRVIYAPSDNLYGERSLFDKKNFSLEYSLLSQFSDTILLLKATVGRLDNTFLSLTIHQTIAKGHHVHPGHFGLGEEGGELRP